MLMLASTRNQSWLVWFLRGLLITGFIILLVRLAELQIVKGSYYRDISEENRIQHIPIPAERGKIYARGGEILEGPEFAHVTGFVAEASKDEIGKIDPECPEKGVRKLGQFVGRGGINEKYNCILTGADGEELVEVNTKGVKIRTLGIKTPISGNDVHTTINYELQLKAVKAMGNKKGAVVATDKQGEVLVFYSSPSFDPRNIKDYLKDKNLPFFNRVIGGLFHPGSTFKPITAISALEEGVIDKEFRMRDEGKITVKTLYGEFTYNNWYFTQYGKTEGEIDLVRALARSTDTFFYKIGEMVGPNALADYSHRFGLDTLTGIDIPGEVKGLVPTPEWKKKVKNEDWFLGNTYHMAIGQGDLAVTPIALNQAILAVATGKLCRPHLTGEASCKDMALKKENLEIVKEGMRQACQPGGTGYPFFDYPGVVYCKTGTAEVGEKGLTHAWFTLFSDDIVLTVLVEEGGEGSRVAGPIAREIMNFYLLQKNP